MKLRVNSQPFRLEGHSSMMEVQDGMAEKDNLQISDAPHGKIVYQYPRRRVVDTEMTCKS